MKINFFKNFLFYSKDFTSTTYLVSQCLRGGVTDAAPVRQTHKLSTQLQNMGKGQVPNINVFFPAKDF